MRGWLTGGLILGLVVVAVLHQTDLIRNVAGQRLPGDMDPLRRVRGYKETAAFVEAAREKLLQRGQPAFIICEHYGLTGLFSFYLPEARAGLRTQPLVYARTTERPENQLFFWPEYRYSEHRQGQNAVYVLEPGTAKLEAGWPWRWLAGKDVRVVQEPTPQPAPPWLLAQFDSVKDLGVHEIRVNGRIYKRVQLFECINLRPSH